MKEVLSLAGGFTVVDLFPSWKLLQKISGAKSRLVDAHHKFDVVFEDIINEHIQTRAAGEKGNDEFVGEDLVDVFLRIKENAQLQWPITNDHIKAVLLDIIVAGTDTSATTIIWALSEMMKNPNVMAKAQNEVREVFMGKKSCDDEDLEKLTYLNLVIKETVRLHPAVPMVLRECSEQTDIAGYTIPHETCGHLGEILKVGIDTESFMPERFENSSIDYMGDQFEFIPFGAGRRICPGIQFGLATVALPLAHILYHFDWEVPSGTNLQDLDMTETQGITAAKKKDLCLITTEYHGNE